MTTEDMQLAAPLRAARAVMLALIVAYGVNAAFELARALGDLREGTLDSPFGAAIAFGGVALAWWVWTLHRRLGRRDRLARTQATSVHAIAAAVWGIPLLILAVGLVSGQAVTIEAGDRGALLRDMVIVGANLFVIAALRVAKDCDRELAVPAPAAALTFDEPAVAPTRRADGTVDLFSPAPARSNWVHAPPPVHAAALLYTTLTVVHVAALLLSFRSCDDCATGQLLGSLTALVLSPFVIVACAGALLVAIGVVRRWKSARSVGVLLAAVFMLTAPIVDQLLFGGIESSLRGGAKAVWNGELAFLVAAANVVLMVLLTRPASRGWELTRERVVRMMPVTAPPAAPQAAGRVIMEPDGGQAGQGPRVDGGHDRVVPAPVPAVPAGHARPRRRYGPRHTAGGTASEHTHHRS